MLKPSSLLVAAVVLLCPAPADACGGGTVSAVDSQVDADAQRIFISVKGQTTEVVTQIVVPQSSAAYGVLIPVPVQPALDPEPVSAEDLEALDVATAPSIVLESGYEEGNGCSCLPAGPDVSGRGSDFYAQSGIQPLGAVDIGPVTAVVLAGDTATAVDDWLREHDFAISDDDRPILEAYAGGGQYFIAIRRNQAVANRPRSIGVHFTLPGDQRGLPLRFARIGAASQVAFTVFVAADRIVGPTLPFETLTLDDLDAGLLRADRYGAAVDRAVAAHSGRAFVLENTQPKSALVDPRLASGVRRSLDGSPFLTWIAEGATLTRWTTRLPAESLSEDVAFDLPYDGPHPYYRSISPGTTALRPAHAGSLLALVLAAVLRRSARRSTRAA